MSLVNLLAQASTPPLDLAPSGSDVANFIMLAAIAGTGILAGLWGIRVIIRAFDIAAGTTEAQLRADEERRGL